MEQKILEGLKKAYSNLGLSDKVFETSAKMLAMMAGTVEEADQDAKVTEMVANAKDMLTSIQSFGDFRASKSKNKGDEDKQNTHNQDGGSASGNEEMLKLLNEMNETNKALTERITALEGAKQKQTRDELIDGIAKELGLTGKHLEYAKALLSDEMDETAIRDSLGNSKKDFIKMGLHMADDPADKLSKEQALIEEEKKWVADFKAQQEEANKY